MNDATSPRLTNPAGAAVVDNHARAKAFAPDARSEVPL
jgi:hypothetical protein